MNDKIFQKLHTKQMSHLFRRVAAAVVAISMILPATTMAAGAFPMYMEEPIKMREGEAPTITIESNAVVDRWYDPEGPESAADYLTGELEVVIRAKSGCVIGEGGSEEWQGFNTLGVALKYSPLLEPYQWTDGEKAIDLTGTSVFDEMTNQQTLKDKNVTTAMAQVSGETGKGGYLYFNVEANRPIVLKEDTVLAVVTFRYDLETVGPILAEDAAQWLTPVKSDGSTGGGTGDGGDAGTEGGETTRTATDCLIQFATVADLEDHSQLCELVYNSAYGENFDHFNTMYYSDPASGVGVEAKDPADGSVSIDYNRLPLNTDSYTADGVKEHHVNFTLVNKPTYNDGGLSLDDLASVLLFDWDNTLLGVLIVPRDADARQIVNAYIQENLIHPDLQGNTNYTSMARKDNYRGKYPSSGPMADGVTDGTEVDDGSKYLTGKLDYVLLKRPMEQVVTTNDDGEEVPVPNQWKQKTAVGEDGTETAVWDVNYPYIHGWAVVDYSHPENTWTTLGMGELSAYSGASGGGYVELNGAAAELTVSGQNFTFANFDFRKNNSLEPGSIYAVKAVYEPGEDLLNSGYLYRMISEPYYNKMNNVSASNGGAYSIDVAFERATLEVGDVVRGTARARLPIVRQDTTTDLLWEENEELGVSHNLPNASNDESYFVKNKTTFTKVDVENVDEIYFSLTLSARQNKVDYYIQEAYGASFVGGGARTDNDNNRSFEAATLDNYNYFVEGESDQGDDWYDALYGDRDGSQGFVLTGTLNQIMELATQVNNGELTADVFVQYTQATILADINLRMADGTAPSLPSQLTSIREAICAAAENAKTNHYGETGYWNSDPDHDCAELNYHQLQLFVMDYLSNGTASLRSPAAADKEILKWCHLHEECVAKTSGKPRNWNELIAAALDGDAVDKICKLTPTEVEGNFHLRADADGTPFATVLDFANAVIAAVRAGNTTWDRVQDYIIRKQASDAYAQANYWWYDGSTSVRLNSLNNLIATTADIFTPVTLPDGSSGPREAKFNQLIPIFEANKALAGDETDASWVLATENLVKTDEAEKFASFDEFKTAFVGAIQALGTDATWNEVQYYILHGTDPAGDPNAETEYLGYYWHNGGRKVTDVRSMLEAAQKANEGDTVSWDAFTYADLYNYPGLHFRKDFAGTQYSAGEFDAFKDTIKAWAAQGTNRSWEQVQYYLIHGSIGLNIGAETQYYWWVNGGTGDSVDFSGIAGYSTAVDILLDAAFRYELNGNIHAWDDLTTDMLKTARLVAGDNGADTFDSLDHFASTADFRTALTGLVAAAGGMAPSGSQALVNPIGGIVSWQQMQYYLLNGTFVDATTAGDYWWRLNDSQSSQKEPEEYFAEVTAALQEIFDGNGTSAIDDWIRNVDNLNAIFFNPNDPAGGFTQDDADLYADSGFIWEDFVNSGAFGSAADISWYQVQSGFINWGYGWMSDSDLRDSFINMGAEIPDWVPAPVSLFSMKLRVAPDPTSAQIMALTEQVNNLMGLIRSDPSKAEDYVDELNDLIAALEELKALLGQEEGPVTDDVPELPEVPVEPPVVETPEESQQPALPGEPEEPGAEEEGKAPETPDIQQPEESLKPEPSEEPEPSEDPAESEGPSDPVEPVTPEEPDTPGQKDPEGNGEGTDAPPKLPEPDPPEPSEMPESSTPELSAAAYSTRPTAKWADLPSSRLISLTNLLFDSGGYKMNGIMIQKNIGPPGHLILRLPWQGLNDIFGRTYA